MGQGKLLLFFVTEEVTEVLFEECFFLWKLQKYKEIVAETTDIIGRTIYRKNAEELTMIRLENKKINK